MARKSVKGYSEKNYYDNTKFTGGVVATHDILNEGSFKHLVNFDISDMGQSLSPRKGFITTTLKYKDEVITLSDSTIYFFDANIGKYIFIDFKKGSRDQAMRYIPCIYKATLDLNAEYITNVEKIDNLDTSELLPYLRSKDTYNAVPEYGYMLELVPVDNNIAQSIIDEYGITKYIIKVTTRNIQFWMSIVYREKETKYENVTYPANTVVLSYLNFDDTVNINTADRNIASGSSIIPNPIQVFYDEANEPPGFVETFPLIYVKQNDDYLLQTTQKLDGLEFIPHFALKEITDENYTWAYTYDIISTSLDSQYFDEEVVHRATLYDLKTNEILIDQPTELIDAYTKMYFETFDKYTKNKYNYIYTCSQSKYNMMLKELSKVMDKNKSIDEAKYTYILYITPYVDGTLTPVTFEKDYTNSDISLEEVYTRFTGSTFEYDTEWVGEYVDHINEAILNNSIMAKRSVSRIQLDLPESCTRQSLIDLLKDYSACRFYLKRIIDITEDYADPKVMGYDNIVQTALYSKMIAFEDQGLSYTELASTLKDIQDINTIFIKTFNSVANISFSSQMITGDAFPNNTGLCKLFKGLDDSSTFFYFYFDAYDTGTTYVHPFDTFVINEYDVYAQLFKLYENTEDVKRPILSTDPMIFNYELAYDQDTTGYVKYTEYKPYTPVNIEDALQHYYGPSVFSKSDGIIKYTYNTSNLIINTLSVSGYFDTGAHIKFYIIKIPKKEYIDNDTQLSEIISYTRNYFVNTGYVQSRQVILSSVKPTTIIQRLEAEPADIATAKESLIFRSSLGDCLVLYIGNKVYMSEPSYQYYFKYTGVYEYPEPIIKVIQYKDTLLVFTTQNLYSIYPTEITNSVENGTDEEGNTKYVQVTTTVYATLPVLYNLMVDSRYKDAIQVYNQMVLFYSADGQMFMIKPSATIDSDTRFSIQYFNKSVNDILLNYKEYMQERLESYGIEGVIEDVNIKVSVSINFIKIFYSAPGLMTYILIYDIINNRYYIYDTLDFTNVRDFWYNDGFEVYVSKRDNFMYFTQQLNEYADTSQYYNFTQHGIETELDTGTINLNNHLKKRFKDIHVMYKNITADTLKFSVDTYVDDVPVYIDIQSSIEVRSVASKDTYVVVDSDNKVNLLEENTALFDFSKYNSNRILTHRTNIVSRGKTFRTQFHFNSTGLYKIMGYGIIYKEHTV